MSRARSSAKFTGRKIRTYPSAFGFSTALEVTEKEDVTNHGRALVQRLNLRGVAKVDFKRGPDDKLHILEINPASTFGITWGRGRSESAGSGLRRRRGTAAASRATRPGRRSLVPYVAGHIGGQSLRDSARRLAALGVALRGEVGHRLG